MNKKTKNIVSVLQSMSAAVLCTLCSVLFLASCTDENLVDNPHAQNALRTLSVDLGMPHAKPAYADGTASRAALDAQPAEILLGDSTLAVSRAEGGSEATTSDWANGDQLLVRIDAGSTQARLTLKYYDPAGGTAYAWYLAKANSYVKYTGTAFTAYNAEGVTPLFAEDTYGTDADMPISETLTMHIDYISTATQATVSIIYAPDMQWSLSQVDNTVSMEQKANATTQTTAPELWTVGSDDAWTTNQARLRVNTGTGNAGDVVTLTSKAFVRALETKPQDNVYTATTDAKGNAYFYGTTNGELKGNSEDKKFEIKLTKMCVPVQPAQQLASESRSLALDDAKENVIITLEEPITLLEASDVVPVTLAATKAYRIEAKVKRTASAKENLSVIDGLCGITDDNPVGTQDHVDFVKAQIKAALALGVRQFKVVNGLAGFTGNNTANTVVGNAFNTIAEYKGKISLELDNTIESVPSYAFYYCYAINDITTTATSIGDYAFRSCSYLTNVNIPNVTTIGDNAFDRCTKLASITTQATTIGKQAFYNCSGLTALNLTAASGIQIGEEAFSISGTGSLTTLNLPNVSSIGKKAFYGRSELQSVTTAATTIGEQAFMGCSSLTAVTLTANSETTIGKQAFYGSQYLNNTSITFTLPAVATTIGEQAFYGRKGLTNVENLEYVTELGASAFQHTGLSGEVNLPNVTSIRNQAFWGTDITKVTVSTETPSTAVTLGESVFNSCASLKDVILYNVTSLAKEVFKDCTSLEDLTLPNVTTLGSGVFYNCTSLKDVNLPDVTSLGTQVFYNCTSLVDLTLPNVTSLGTQVFYGCTGLKKLTFQKVVTPSFDSFQYTDVTGCELHLLEEQINTNSKVSVSNSRLKWGGTEWKSITLTDGTKYEMVDDVPTVELDGSVGGKEDIDNTDITTMKNKIIGVIERDKKLGKVIVKNQLAEYSNGTYVKTVVDEAIRSITQKEQSVILVLDDATTIPEQAFMNCNTLASVEAPKVTTIPKEAFYGCYFISSVSVGSNASGNITVGDSAFYGCNQLTNLRFELPVVSVGDNALNGNATTYNPWTIYCALTLVDGQQNVEGLKVTALNSQLMWADKNWKCITVGAKEYEADGNTLKEKQ
ncbi:MAG: leucine-rich repeat protein [Bacteroides sp.]|nr:leucine-rich repeat protein [Bacteroides sp.]